MGILHTFPAPAGQRRTPVASDGEPPDNGQIMSMTREELDVRLQLVEAKADARMSRFEERIDLALDEMRRERIEVKTELKSTRTTMVVTAIASVIAIVGGIASFNATVLGNMLASYQNGKDTGTSLATTAEQLKVIAADIKAAQQQRQALTNTEVNEARKAAREAVAGDPPQKRGGNKG